jgi:hypothetical protein
LVTPALGDWKMTVPAVVVEAFDVQRRARGVVGVDANTTSAPHQELVGPVENEVRVLRIREGQRAFVAGRIGTHGTGTDAVEVDAERTLRAARPRG